MKGKAQGPTCFPAHAVILPHHSRTFPLLSRHHAFVLVSPSPGKSLFCWAGTNLICYILHFLPKCILLPFILVCCTLETDVFISYKMIWCPTNRKCSKHASALNQIYNSACLSHSFWERLGRGPGTGFSSPQVRSRIQNLPQLVGGWMRSVIHLSLGHSVRPPSSDSLPKPPPTSGLCYQRPRSPPCYYT